MVNRTIRGNTYVIITSPLGQGTVVQNQLLLMCKYFIVKLDFADELLLLTQKDILVELFMAPPVTAVL